MSSNETPFDLANEAALIGALVGERSAETLPAVRPLLLSEHFSLEQHSLLYATICQIADENGTVAPAPVADATPITQDSNGTPVDSKALQLYLQREVADWGMISGIAAARKAAVIVDYHQRRTLAALGEKLTKASLAGGDVDVVLAEISDVPERPSEHGNIVSVGADVMMECLESVEWLWQSWIPKGFLTVVAGDPGIKKSALLLYLACTLGAAGKWPDGTQPESPGTTFWLDAEGMQRPNMDRMRDWGFAGEPIRWAGADGLDAIQLRQPGEFRRLGEHAADSGDSLLVLDSLRAAHTEDETSGQFAALLNEMRDVAHDTNIGLIAIHHPRKAHEGEGAAITLERLRGTSVIGAIARVVWGLWQPDSENPVVRVEQIKNNLAEYPDPLGFKWDKNPNQLTFLDAPKEYHEETRADRAAEFLQAQLARAPVFWEMLIENAAAQGISKNALYEAKRTLGIHTVELEGVKCWSLPVRM